MLQRADDLFHSVIILELVGKYFSLRKHKSDPSMQKICYCDSEVGDFPTIMCSNIDCKIKYFHTPCIFFDVTPPKKSWSCPDCKDIDKV